MHVPFLIIDPYSRTGKHRAEKDFMKGRAPGKSKMPANSTQAWNRASGNMCNAGRENQGRIRVLPRIPSLEVWSPTVVLYFRFSNNIATAAFFD